MAYPFVQFPTFAEFIGRLTSPEFGCTFETVDAPMMLDGDAEQCISIHFLKHGKQETYALFFYEAEERVTPTLLRSVCARFDIDPKKFGLTLG